MVCARASLDIDLLFQRCCSGMLGDRACRDQRPGPRIPAARTHAPRLLLPAPASRLAHHVSMMRAERASSGPRPTVHARRSPPGLQEECGRAPACSSAPLRAAFLPFDKALASHISRLYDGVFIRRLLKSQRARSTPLDDLFRLDCARDFVCHVFLFHMPAIPAYLARGSGGNYMLLALLCI